MIMTYTYAYDIDNNICIYVILMSFLLFILIFLKILFYIFYIVRILLRTFVQKIQIKL